MFGMSSTEFWEGDPQLYWSYRTFYLKQREVDEFDLKYKAWLQGSIDMLSTSLAITNNFSKGNKKFPTYEELFTKTGSENENGNNNKPMTKKQIDEKIVNEFNAWARY